jgi:2-amino-4-hydroxy-6-hydroxymethyldihydropteridine diphosphokinase
VIVYLALGSNLSDRSANLQAAKDALPPAVRVRRSSSIYETEPWGYADQPAFYNQALEAETRLSPLALLKKLKGIETRLGRTPTFRNGPRLIDIDILFYGQEVIGLPGLTIPHPRLHERPFVLVPLAELAPDFIHPLLQASIAELLARSGQAGVSRLAENQHNPRTTAPPASSPKKG